MFLSEPGQASSSVGHQRGWGTFGWAKLIQFTTCSVAGQLFPYRNNFQPGCSFPALQSLRFRAFIIQVVEENDHLQILLGCFQAFLILWRREIRGSWWRELATSSWLFWRYKSTWNGNSYTSCLEHPLTVLPALSAPAPVWQLSCVWPTGLVKYSCKGKGRWSYLAPSPPEGNAAPARACPEQAQTHWAHNWE